jgi:hypothetical protein
LIRRCRIERAAGRAHPAQSDALGGVVMANKGDEWFYLEWLAKNRAATTTLFGSARAWSASPNDQSIGSRRAEFAA